MEIEKLRAVVFGLVQATQTAVKALIVAHPAGADRLIEAFKQEHQGTMATLLSAPIERPGEVIAAYRDFLAGMAPNVDEWMDKPKGG